MSSPQAPPGWYPNPDLDGEGMRWWDGAEWTDPPAPSLAPMRTPAPKRWGLWLLAVGAALGIIGVVANAGARHHSSPIVSVDPPYDTPTTDSGSVFDTPDTVTTEPAYTAADDSREKDKGWVVMSTHYSVDSLGLITITERLRNANLDRESAFFTITAFHAQQVVSTFKGVVNSVEPGAVVTVDFSNADGLTARQLRAAGVTSTRFQTDVSTPS